MRRRIGRALFWVVYGFAPLWLAAIMAQLERRGDLTASAGQRGGEYQIRRCAGCGDDLNDVEWVFDPCPDSEEGTHREAS